jgi:amino acid transporter
VKTLVKRLSVVTWLLILAGFWTVMIFGGLAGLGQYRDVISVVSTVLLGLLGMTLSVYVLADLTKSGPR